MTPEPHRPLPPEFAPLHRKRCLVRTHEGAPVGEGLLRVAEYPLVPDALRLDLHLETAKTACIIGIPRTRLAALAASWDGTACHFTLPPGKAEWLVDPPPAAPLDPVERLEGFPPPRSAPAAPVAGKGKL